MYEEIAGTAVGLEMWVLGESRIADTLTPVNTADSKDDAVGSAIKVMTHLGMGLDLVEYAQFRHLASGRVAMIHEDSWSVQISDDDLTRRDVGPADVAWILDYVSRQIVRLERTHPTLRAFTHSSVERDPDRLRDLKFFPIRPRRLGAG